jgi:hypothetical protein
MTCPNVPESKLHPADQADETLAKEEWLDRFEPAVEDVENALCWHEETYGNEYLNTCAALWFCTWPTREDAKERRAKSMQDAIDEIVKTYAEEVLWPEFKKKERI